jgi:alkylation response protein AidB-like acyl-CoA dehydrogenase
MLRDLGGDRLQRLSEAIARHGAARDADGRFPAEAFAELEAQSRLADPPVAPGDMRALLALLAAVGRGDLSTGRIFEGHVNAVYLVSQFGSAAQKARLAAEGGLLGVWNTDAPEDPLRLVEGRLQGKKAFASGVDGLTQAIVTVTGAAGRQMILAPTRDLAVDRSWWRPLGMRASGSHVADLSGIAVAPDWLLGGPDDYIRQPWFSAGAIRFLAVQVGGMHGILDTAGAHLGRTGRAGNPYQAHRLARMGVAVETGYLWLGRVAEAWSRAADPRDEAAERALTAAADGARLAVETAAMELLAEAERAIGAAGLIAPHPFERRMRDLRTYLRQPNPDGAAAAFGAAIAAGEWSPSRDCGSGCRGAGS